MSLHARVSSVWKTITAFYVRVSGVWKSVETAYVKVDDVWEIFWGEEASGGGGLTVDGPGGDTTLLGSFTGTYQTSHVVYSPSWAGVTVTGNTGSLTYSWARVSASVNMQIYSGSTTSAPIWKANCVNGVDKVETWRCTVTDSAGNTGTVDIEITLMFNSFL